ncbi:MAG: anti-sigma factor antagonist [Firmicutes bacterium]|nr:anti-sigma factor antagonist [Bacillota bacterium]
MDLIITVKNYQHKSWLCVKPSGELDMAVADDFRARITEAMQLFGCRCLWCDFSAVSFIDSSGLGVLLGRYRELAPFGGKIIITGASESVYRLLLAGGLHKLMEIDRPLSMRYSEEGI